MDQRQRAGELVGRQQARLSPQSQVQLEVQLHNGNRLRPVDHRRAVCADRRSFPGDDDVKAGCRDVTLWVPSEFSGFMVMIAPENAVPR